jgi:hypothetical protein
MRAIVLSLVAACIVVSDEGLSMSSTFRSNLWRRPLNDLAHRYDSNRAHQGSPDNCNRARLPCHSRLQADG